MVPTWFMVRSFMGPDITTSHGTEPFIIQDLSPMDMEFITTLGPAGDSLWVSVMDGYISVRTRAAIGDEAVIDMAIVMGTEEVPTMAIGVDILQEGGLGIGQGPTPLGKEAVISMEEGQMVSEAPVPGVLQQIVLQRDRHPGRQTNLTMCILIETVTHTSVITMATGNSEIINPATGKTTTGRIQEAGIGPIPEPGIGLERRTARTVTRVPLHSKTGMRVLRIEVLKTGVIILIRITRIETGVHNGQIAITAVPAGLPEVARVVRDGGSQSLGQGGSLLFITNTNMEDLRALTLVRGIYFRAEYT